MSMVDRFRSSSSNTTGLLMNLTEIYSPENEYFESPVFLGADGEIKSAIYIDLSLLVLKIISCVLGIFLNMTAILVVLMKQDLNITRKPRDVFVLATLFSNLLMCIPALLEIVYFYYPTNELICLFFVATSGLPEVFISQSNFLSLLDRFLDIQYPLWYSNKITIPWSILWTAVSFVVAIFVNKFPYIFQLVELDCHIHFVSNRIPLISSGIFFVLCVIFRVIIFLKTRNLIKGNKALPAAGEFKFDENLEGDQKVIDPHKGQFKRKNTIIELHQTKMDEDTLLRLEDEATRTAITGVTILLVFTFPRLVLPFVLAICKKYYKEYYRFVRLFVPYFKQLGPVNAVCHPIIYLHQYWNRLCVPTNILPITNKTTTGK